MLDYDYTNDILNINVDEIAIDMSKHGITPKSFSTPLTWLDFEFNGIATDKAVGIGISNIMGQIFSNLPYDLVRPAIYETDTAGRLFAKEPPRETYGMLLSRKRNEIMPFAATGKV